MIKLMIFDLDGTLLYTLEDLAIATNHVLREHGLPEHSLEEYRYFVGNGLKTQITRALPEEKRGDAALIDLLAARELEYYNAHMMEHTRPYPGVLEALRELEARGLLLAVVTNKPDVAAQSLMERLFPGIHFFCVWGKRSGVPLKPDPAGVNAIIGQAGVSRAEVLYFGDSGVDMETAKNAGVTGVGVLWGYRDEQELLSAGAARLITEPHELTRLD